MEHLRTGLCFASATTHILIQFVVFTALQVAFRSSSEPLKAHYYFTVEIVLELA